MSEYLPDNWVVVRVSGGKPQHRVLAGWSGGYTTGSSWRMNSGITKVHEDESFYYFYGVTGSIYRCGKQSYCLRTNNAYIWEQLKERYGDKVEIMPEDTDWANYDWGLNE